MEEVDVFENGTEATGIMDMKLDKVEAVSRNALLVSTDSLLMSGNVLASFGVPFFANMATALL